MDGDGNIYTTEGSVCRVQQFTAEGKFLRAWGADPDKPGGFGGAWMGQGSLRGPVGIGLDEQGRVWVAPVSGRVQRFSPDAKYLGGPGDGAGGEPGQFRAPHGLAADGRGHLYVVDSYNHRVQKFAIAP